MLTPAQRDYVKDHAYLPEHLIEYVNTISQTEPFLIEDYLCYYGRGSLIFIGYPLRRSFDERVTKETLSRAIKKFNPDCVALESPVILLPKDTCHRSGSDRYYKCTLSYLHVHQKLRNMIKRASRELYVNNEHVITDEHIQLISEFLNSHEVDDSTQYIFERIPQYISSVETARIFSARDKSGRLVAFDVAEFGAKNYVFYLFNFRSKQKHVPGASDFLLYEIVKVAEKQGKSSINLGLGINSGITFFKKKWGGIPFLNYEFCFYQRSRNMNLKYLMEKLS